MLRVSLFMSWVLCISFVNGSFKVPIRKLQAILDAKAQLWNTSFSVGVHHAATGGFGAASGLADRFRSKPTTVKSRFPLGSVTKAFTTVAVMRQYEQGNLDIDLPIAKYVDPILKRDNGTSLMELWEDRRIMNVTGRMLLGMRSGIPDYDDNWFYELTLKDPNYDVTPYEILRHLRKELECEPGTCGLYSSPGFELLGLALAEVAGAKTWLEYDQLKGTIPPELLPNYKGTQFMLSGLCNQYTDVVHQ